MSASATLLSEAWREDLRFLASEMRRTHPDLFFALSEQAFTDAVKSTEEKLPHLSNDQILVELIKLVALPGVVGGRDGHSYVPLFQKATGFHALPLQLEHFSGGWFVTHAQAAYQKLVGRRLVRVGSTSADKVATLLAPLVSRDNEMTLRARLGDFIVVPELLRAAGVVEDVDTIPLVLAGCDELGVRAVTGAAYEAWEPLPSLEPFRADYLGDSGTLLIDYNAVQAKTSGGETVRQFSERLRSIVESKKMDRVVVDIRRNGGGNNTTYRPLLEFLTQTEAVNQPGKLFVMLGRHTFSAAGNFAVDLKRRSHALFVGEPMGGGVNQYGDNVPVILPNSGLEARVASRYWQMSAADDVRLTLTPDISVELRAEDVFAGRDRALAAALAYAPPDPRK